MELKKYQIQTLRDLEDYISVLNKSKNLSDAYTEYWKSKGVDINGPDIQYLHSYVNSVKRVPRVTLKVPTAGGKTFIACNAIKTIIDNLQIGYQNKVVAWFVPSDTILKQTLKNLQDVNHPYRKKIDSLFNHHVIVVDKESALVAQGISPANLLDNLTIFVLSAQSFIETIKVKSAKSQEESKPRAFRENGNFIEHVRVFNQPEKMIEGADPTALIQILAQQNPIVIVDESHNFKADLRVELLNNLSPRFILELTATPRENSNIISFVDAMQLKKENMVKLPVIVENRKSVQDVLRNAINMRNSLEEHAQELERQGGKYIRPIVLFQAQPKNSDDNITFDKIKSKLEKLDIPEEQIKIKTAQKDELNGIDLMDRNCQVRYIITVNALREGWDCPFAYILASLANRTSAVEVEQILGRVLRQPYTAKHTDDLLNLSYVFTSSIDFIQTVNKIIDSLMKIGFSRKDYKAVENNTSENTVTQTPSLFDNDSKQYDTEKSEELEVTTISDEEIELIKIDIQTTTPNKDIEKLQEEARKLSTDYNKQIEEDSNNINNSLAANTSMPDSLLKSEYKEVAQKIHIPTFFIKSDKSIFSEDEWIPLEKDMLTEEFNLPSKDATIAFEFYNQQGVAIDVEKNEDDYIPMQKNAPHALKIIREQYLDKDVSVQKGVLSKQIASMIQLDNILESHIQKYVEKAIENLDSDKISELFDKIDETKDLIQKKIISLLKDHHAQVFQQWLDVDKIKLQESFSFPEKVTFTKTELFGISKGLYTKEETVNKFEYKVISAIAKKDNVLFWHRNPEKTGFCINGFINHYPDIIVQMKSGKTVLVETKGNFLNNDETKDKIDLGRRWADLAGPSYGYFMVFDSLKEEGAIDVPQLLQYLDEL